MTERNIWHNEVHSTDLEEGQKKIREILLWEIEELMDNIHSINPNISTDKELLYERYLWILRYLKDPFIDFLEWIERKEFRPEELDQALEVIKARSAARTYILDCLQNNTSEEQPTNLWVRDSHELRRTCIHFHDNRDEITKLLSLKQRKYLSVIIYALVVWKMWLMFWELAEGTQPHIQEFYELIEEINRWVLSGDQTLWLIIVWLFWYEAFVKIKEVWLSAYAKHNTFDFWLNILWLAEVGIGIKDAISWEVHPWIISALRSLRSLRLLQLMWRMKSTKPIFDAIYEASPWVIKITWIYAGFSLVTMVILTQLTKWHVEELSSLWSALNEMRNLFYADGFQDVLHSIETNQTMDGVSKWLASFTANTYMLLSSTFYFAIPTALFADLVNKSWKRGEQIISLTLERVDQIIWKVDEWLQLLIDIKKLLTDKKSQ